MIKLEEKNHSTKKHVLLMKIFVRTKSQTLVYITEARWQGVKVIVRITFVTAPGVGIGPSSCGRGVSDLVPGDHEGIIF